MIHIELTEAEAGALSALLESCRYHVPSSISRAFAQGCFATFGANPATVATKINIAVGKTEDEGE